MADHQHNNPQNHEVNDDDDENAYEENEGSLNEDEDDALEENDGSSNEDEDEENEDELEDGTTIQNERIDEQQNTRASDNQKGTDSFVEASLPNRHLKSNILLVSGSSGRGKRAEMAREYLLEDLKVVERFSALATQLQETISMRPKKAKAQQSIPEGEVAPLGAKVQGGIAECESWKAQLAEICSAACQSGGSRFSHLLYARLVLVNHEIQSSTGRAQVSKDTAVSYSRHINFSTPLQGPRTKIQSLPAIAAIGLKSFFLTLRSLVKERHELLGEVCRAVCTTLEGLPSLSLVDEDREVLDGLQGVLEELVQNHLETQNGELALRATFFLGSLTRRGRKCAQFSFAVSPEPRTQS